MSSTNVAFSDAAFIKADLFREPLYRADDPEKWATLKCNLDEIKRYFYQIGQELVFDEGEGYAFIRQMAGDAEAKIPRLVQTRPLNYETTLLLVFLRDELDRFEASGTDAVRMVLSREQLRSFVEPYVRVSHDKARDRDRIDEAISRLVKLGFLRRQPSEDTEEFQVMRIIKARLGATELEEIKRRLLRNAFDLGRADNAQRV